MPPLRLPVGSLPLDVDSLGGRLTSDGGLPWLAAADADLGLTAPLAVQIPDWRTRRGRHTLPELVAQRVYQIACGHADQTVRRWLAAAGVPPMTLGTLRLRQVKIGGWVREEAARVQLRLASSHPSEGWWRLLAARHHPS